MRLSPALDDWHQGRERIDIFDTGGHRVFGVAQAQSTDQTLAFISQDGLVQVSDLPKVRD
jgi:hypothetical protein